MLTCACSFLPLTMKNVLWPSTTHFFSHVTYVTLNGLVELQFTQVNTKFDSFMIVINFLSEACIVQVSYLKILWRHANMVNPPIIHCRQWNQIRDEQGNCRTKTHCCWCDDRQAHYCDIHLPNCCCTCDGLFWEYLEGHSGSQGAISFFIKPSVRKIHSNFHASCVVPSHAHLLSYLVMQIIYKELIYSFVICFLCSDIYFLYAAMVSYVSCGGTMVWFLGYSIALWAVVLHNDSNLHKGMLLDWLVVSSSSVTSPRVHHITIFKVYILIYCNSCQSWCPVVH